MSLVKTEMIFIIMEQIKPRTAAQTIICLKQNINANLRHTWVSFCCSRLQGLSQSVISHEISVNYLCPSWLNLRSNQQPQDYKATVPLSYRNSKKLLHIWDIHLKVYVAHVKDNKKMDVHKPFVHIELYLFICLTRKIPLRSKISFAREDLKAT